MICQAFNRSGARPKGSSGNDFLGAILRERPDLQGQTAYFPEQGIEAHTVFIGDEVFKGPLDDDWGTYFFDREHVFLKSLEGHDLPIPKVTCVGEETYFFGMSRMRGVMLGENFDSWMTPDGRRTLAQDLVAFVMRLANALPMQEGKFAAHRDLHYDNILIDPETKRFSAVIDFGRFGYVDKNEWKPHEDFPPSFIKMFLDEFNARKSELPDPPPAPLLPPPPPKAPPQRSWLKRLLFNP